MAIFDAVLTYQFIKKLTTPFNKMKAYQLGLIDDKGNFLRDRSEFRVDERNALGLFDIMVINLKKLIAKIPGGASRMGTVAATLYLLRSKPLREDTSYEDLEKQIEEEFFKIYNTISEDGVAAINSAGSGDIAGLGQPPGSAKGFPPVSPSAANRYKKANKAAAPILKMVKRKPLTESYLEESTLQYHKQLNPKLWDVMGELKDDVRGKLLQIADAWVAFAKIPPDLIYDVIITGGNVNYNYTPNSDIDLHIVTSRSAINPVRAFVDEYLQDKKILWTLTHPDICIYGFPVELYAQDVDEQPHLNQGVYSLTQRRWIARPQMLDLEFENDFHLQKKVDFYKDMIDKLIENKADKDAIDTLKKKMKTMRGDAIAQGGEFSFGNLVFKELRNLGYLDKLNDYEKTMQDKALSLPTTC